MNEITYQKVIKVGLSSFLSILYNAFSPTFNLLNALAIVIALDFAIGIYQSFTGGNKFNPKKFLGKLKEIGLFVVVLAAAIFINPLWEQYGLKAYFVANSFIGMYGFYHFFSIVQNAGKLGFPIANQFQRFIESKANDLANISKKDEVINEDKK